MQILSYLPGTKATISLVTLNADGYRADGYILPFVSRIVLPDFCEARGFPINMVRYDVGLYYFQYCIPNGAIAVGSYLVDVSYANPDTEEIMQTLYQLVVSAPYGNFGISPFFHPYEQERHPFEHHFPEHRHHESEPYPYPPSPHPPEHHPYCHEQHYYPAFHPCPSHECPEHFPPEHVESPCHTCRPHHENHEFHHDHYPFDPHRDGR